MADCTADPSRIIPHTTLRPGLSVGDEQQTIGTLGLFVVDATDTLCLLSAKHVLAPQGSPKVLAPIKHPAPKDAPSEQRHVASLWWWAARLDAALARIEPGIVCAPELMESGQLVRTFRPPEVGDVLEKSARTTGVTRAVVTSTDVPADGLPSTFLLEQLDGDPEPISCEGDSGAVWYDPVTGAGVGLHHGGEPDDGIAIAVSLILIKSSWDMEPWNGTFIDAEEVAA